jgi:catechol 2,3-dioxygenase-like lactoylglutathione lyase family enzyme
MPVINIIHHTAFTVSNIERSIAFYRDILGMKVLWDSVQAGVKYKGPVCDKITGCPGTEQHLVYLGIGESFLELVEFTPMGKPLENNKASDIGASHICLKTDDINALYEKLLANNVAVHCPPQNRGELSVFYFRDPDGIILEAIEGKTKV